MCNMCNVARFCQFCGGKRVKTPVLPVPMTLLYSNAGDSAVISHDPRTVSTIKAGLIDFASRVLFHCATREFIERASRRARIQWRGD